MALKDCLQNFAMDLFSYYHFVNTVYCQLCLCVAKQSENIDISIMRVNISQHVEILLLGLKISPKSISLCSAAELKIHKIKLKKEMPRPQIGTSFTEFCFEIIKFGKQNHANNHDIVHPATSRLATTWKPTIRVQSWFQPRFQPLALLDGTDLSILSRTRLEPSSFRVVKQ